MKRIVEAIAMAQTAALLDCTNNGIFQDLLSSALELIECKSGFIGEVVAHHETNIPYLLTHAFSQKHQSSMPFMQGDNIFSHIIASKQAVIANNMDGHPHFSKRPLPKFHIDMQSFMGIPFIHEGQVIGILGFANHKTGQFTEEHIEYLQPFLITVTSILQSRRTFAKLKRADAMLNDANAKMEITIKERTKELHSALQAKDHLLASISHDLRTPLNSIIGTQNLLEHTNLTEEQHEYVKLIGSGAKLLLTLVNDVLSFSTMQTIKFQDFEFDLRDTVEDVLDMCAAHAHQNQLELVHFFDAKFPKRMVLSDSDRLSQIIMNLVNNAVKFTSTGQVVIRSELVELHVDHLVAKFSVQDTGIGIHQDDISKLCIPFSQIANKNVKGTGLGLVICKQLVERFEGTFQITSELNVGSIFSFTAKLKLAPSTISPTLVSEPILNETICIVCDRKLQTESLLMMLKELGFAKISTSWQENCTFGLVSEQLLSSIPKSSARIVAICNIDTAYKDAKLTVPIRFKQVAATMNITKAATPQRTQIAAQTSGSGRVLIVDDNEINLKVLKHMLKKLNVECDCASGGKGAIEFANQNKYSLILMDLQMPDMSGSETTEALIAQGITCPIVAVSANVINSTGLDELLKVGFCSYLAKPVSFDQITATIKQYLN